MANVYGFDPVAYSIDGGRHRGELQRVQLYAATGGTEGIIESPDCKVRQLTTAGTQVRIDAGALLIRNRSASVRNQTYAANGRIESRLDVPAAPAGGRTDLVVVRVEDPQYSPWPTPPAGTAPDYQYVKPFLITGVPSNTATAAALNLGYSAVELARLNLPANTVNVTDAMITDLRKLAQPRRASFFERVDVNNTDPVIDYTPALNTFVRMPSNAPSIPIVVPVWANACVVRVLVTGVHFQVGPTKGSIRANITGGAPSTTISTYTTMVNEQTFGNGARFSYETSDEMLVPAAMRGATCQLTTWWRKESGTGNPRTHHDSQVVADVTWLEVAE